MLVQSGNSCPIAKYSVLAGNFNNCGYLLYFAFRHYYYQIVKFQMSALPLMQFEKYELGDEQINLVLKETKVDEKKDQLELVNTVTSFFRKFPNGLC